MSRTVSQVRTPEGRSAPRSSIIEPTFSDRSAVLDCLRVRDLGGDWLGHPSFDAGAHSDEVRDALVRDGLAFWDEFGIHITPSGRRVWAEQRDALADLSLAVDAATSTDQLATLPDLPPVQHAGERVLTTELLTRAYGVLR